MSEKSKTTWIEVKCPNLGYRDNAGSCFTREMDGSWWCSKCRGTGVAQVEVPTLETCVETFKDAVLALFREHGMMLSYDYTSGWHVEAWNAAAEESEAKRIKDARVESNVKWKHAQEARP